MAAIVLAAGKGGRIGRPKYDLLLGGVPFWRLIFGRLLSAGVRDVALVIRRSQKTRMKSMRGIRLVVNRRPSRGMLSSVQCGLGAMGGYDGYMICPVDHPGVKTGTYRALLKGFSASPGSIVRPSYEGRSGHPIIIPGSLFGEIRQARPEKRLDRVLQGSKAGIKPVKMADQAVLHNINTIAELRIASGYHRKTARRRS